MKSLLFRPVNIFANPIVIDIIRGIAVLLVFIAHADAYGMVNIWPFYIQPIKLYMGHLGVAIFFILSGFLIWNSATKNIQQNNLKIYFINRVTRIFPLYLICIIVVWALSGLFIGYYRPNVTFENVLWHLIFSQHFADVSRTINPVLWTLTHEATFYVLVPLLLVLRFFTPLICALSIPITQYLWMINNNLSVFIKFWALFAIGILIAQHYHTLKKRFALLILVLGIVFSISIKGHIGSFVVASSLVLLLIQVKDSDVSKGLIPLAWLGLISYSVYIWHYLIIELVSPYLIKYQILSNNHFFRGLMLCLIVLAFSFLSYRYIEHPFMHKVRKRFIS